MFKKYMILAGFILCLSATDALAETHYSAVIEDLPLMTGMVESTDDAVIFDKAQGRILETIIHTQKTEEEIIAFYAKTLPALGWQQTKTASFLREGEILTIFFTKKNLDSVDKDVHFRISPQ